MRVEFLDLTRQYRALKLELDAAIANVLQSQRFILGPEVRNFEHEAAAALSVDHAIGVSSGSDALYLALRAAGIGPGDEVLTTPLSFVATVESILRVGASVRFADVELEHLQLDPASVAEAITKKTRAILAVHLFGHASGLDQLAALCRRHQLVLIEDAAQAFGARFRGQCVGSFGQAGCFSFFPAKPLGGFGDGGMVVTSHAALAERIRRLRQHGQTELHQYAELGGNFRLDAIQAAVLRVKLPRLSAWLSQRAKHAAAYDAAFADLPGVRPVRAPEQASSSHAVYTLRVVGGDRDELAAFLKQRGVDTACYYPRPLYRQGLFASAGFSELPNAETAARQVLSLPLYPELLDSEREYVIESVKAYFER